MPFNWNEFLTLAEELATRNDEASKRSAISRAYYSVYHLAAARVAQRSGPRPEGLTSHSWCWNKYQTTNDRACVELGNRGSRMKRRRNLADYEDNMKRLDDELRLVLDEARQFPTDLAALDMQFSTPPASTIFFNRRRGLG
jgi:uncharacterized protein (UPF0332 family)